MGNFILGIVVPLPCDDPYDYIEQAMQPYTGEGNRTDGWELLELQLSTRVSATPYAYVAADGAFHERAAEGSYPEEKAYSHRLHALTMEHLAQYGYSHFELLRQRRDEVLEPVTDWHRTWQSVTHERMYVVAFVWCHF